MSALIIYVTVTLSLCGFRTTTTQALTRGRHLVLFGFFFSLTFGGLGGYFFVVLFQGGQILTGFTELTFFHTFTNVVVYEGTLGVHKIEFMVQTVGQLPDGGGVGDHDARALHLGQVTSWNNGWWLVVDTDLEGGWAPVNELDGALGFDGRDGGVDVLGDDIPTVHQNTRHVLPVARVALNHHVGWLEYGGGDFTDAQLFVVRFLGGDDWGERAQWEVNSWVRYQVSLERGHVNTDGTVESKGGRDGTDGLGDQSVQVGVSWSLNVQVTAADIVQGLVVNHEGNVGVLKHTVGAQYGVVWFYNGGGYLWGWVYGELDLGLAAVVNGQAFQKKSTETGTRTSTKTVVYDETLKTSAVVGQLTDAVQAQVNNFFTYGVVTTGVVIGGVFLTRDQLFWVEKTAVGTGADLVDGGGFQIKEHASWYEFTGSGLGEKGSVTVVITVVGITVIKAGLRFLAIRLDTVFQAEKLPARVTDLYTGLAQVDQ